MSSESKDAALKSAGGAVPFPAEGEFLVVNTGDEGFYSAHPKPEAFPGASFRKVIHDDKGTRFFLKYVAGNKEPPHTHANQLEWVVLSGKFTVTQPATGKEFELTAGSYWVCPAKTPHAVTCVEEGEFFIALGGQADFIPYEG